MSVDSLRRLTQQILDEATPAHLLRFEIMQMVDLLTEHAAMAPAAAINIADGETNTQYGLALSPENARMCAFDVKRTVMFLRGVDAAIQTALRDNMQKPIHILYAGCGPLAMLATPLMSVYSVDTIKFTLLDLHPYSVSCVATLMIRLGFSEYVEDLQCIDAMDYSLGSSPPITVIMLELMQSVLAKEPQVAISRHLIAQAPQALLVPESINIRLELVNVDLEFDQNPDIQECSRQFIGEVFRVDRELLLTWPISEALILPTKSVCFPKTIPNTHQAMLFTDIQIFGSHHLANYDSGLSYPRLFAPDDFELSGACFAFHYEVFKSPQLVATRQDYQH